MPGTAGSTSVHCTCATATLKVSSGQIVALTRSPWEPRGAQSDRSAGAGVTAGKQQWDQHVNVFFNEPASWLKLPVCLSNLFKHLETAFLKSCRQTFVCAGTEDDSTTVAWVKCLRCWWWRWWRGGYNYDRNTAAGGEEKELDSEWSRKSKNYRFMNTNIIKDKMNLIYFMIILYYSCEKEFKYLWVLSFVK